MLEGGIGNLIAPEVGQRLYEGALNLLSVVGILPDTLLPFPWATIERPRVVYDNQVFRLRGQRAGLFLPLVSLGERVEEMTVVGQVIDPASGKIREVIKADISGVVVALRKQPVVSPGALLCRLVNDQDSAPEDDIFAAIETAVADSSKGNNLSNGGEEA